MADENGGVAKPAYVGYGTFKNLIVNFAETGLPRRIDASVIHGQSGGTKTALKLAFEFLGLTDPAGVPTSKMTDLTKAYGTDAWNDVWGDIIAAAYSDTIDGVDLDSGTADQLADAFRKADLSGSTLRKAVTFYLSALKDAGSEYSKFFKNPRGGGPGSAGGRKKRRQPRADVVTTSTNDVARTTTPPPAGWRVLPFHIPTRNQPITISAPEDLKAVEWAIVSAYMDAYIKLSAEKK